MFAANGRQFDSFGAALSMFAEVLVVGAPGHVAAGSHVLGGE